MTNRELTQRITDYLTGGGLFNPEMANHERVRDLLIDCRDAFAQPEQEPVAWLDVFTDEAYSNSELDEEAKQDLTPLYTAIPSKQWVELTEDEIIGHTCECVDDGTFDMNCAKNFANSIQEALKRYNT